MSFYDDTEEEEEVGIGPRKKKKEGARSGAVITFDLRWPTSGYDISTIDDDI